MMCYRLGHCLTPSGAVESPFATDNFCKKGEENEGVAVTINAPVVRQYLNMKTL